MTEQSTTDTEIQKIVQLLKEGRPKDAEALCHSALAVSASNPFLMRLLGHAFVRQRRLDDAEQQFRLALTLQPEFPPLLKDLGSLLATKGQVDEAEKLLLKASRLDPGNASILYKLAEIQAASGQAELSNETLSDFAEIDSQGEKLIISGEHLRAGRVAEGVSLLKELVQSHPNNVDALRLLASAYRMQDERLSDAEALLRRAVALAPDYVVAWLNLGALLQDQMRPIEAITCYESALRHEPENEIAKAGMAGAFASSGQPEKAVEMLETLTSSGTSTAGIEMTFGHVLKTVGRQDDSLRAYKRSLQIDAQLGEAYWSMANLKVHKFQDDEVTEMMQLLDQSQISEASRVHVKFALGKAFEDRGDYDSAWNYYKAGNALRRKQVSYDPVEVADLHAGLASTLTPEFIAERKDVGSKKGKVIFIVGLPRSGSTLIEQILASHSQVEGTAELPYLGRIAASMGRYRQDGRSYPEVLTDLRRIDWRGFGDEYLESASRHRTTDAPVFTDKLPNNFSHIGFAALCLPNAKFINTRRFPLDSCLGVFKQLFASGQNFSYDEFELAEYYKDYVRMMEHWHTVLPGRVLDIHYEDTVLDLEAQTRRILDFCELPFEEQCLEFYRTQRSVQTASSEQVRQPIYKGALGRWSQYGQNIEFWKDSLRPIIDGLPERIVSAAKWSG